MRCGGGVVCERRVGVTQPESTDGLACRSCHSACAAWSRPLRGRRARTRRVPSRRLRCSERRVRYMTRVAKGALASLNLNPPMILRVCVAIDAAGRPAARAGRAVLGPRSERRFRGISYVPKGPFGTLNDLKGPFATPTMSRKRLSRHHTLRVRAGRCAPGAREAGVTRQHTPNGKNDKQDHRWIQVQRHHGHL